MLRRLLFVSSVLLALASPAQASVLQARAPAQKPLPGVGHPRPTDAGSPERYAVPEAAPYAGSQVVVHYVTQTADAPPLHDADATGVPDYVEQIAVAADRALDFYAKAGFRRVAPDLGGPDAKPDLYVQRLGHEDILGGAFAPKPLVRDQFVLIAPFLDVGFATTQLSLSMTVAHELFHLVQFAYADGNLPLWVAEGTATAMQTRVYPNLRDASTQAHLGLWLKTTWYSLHDERDHCVRCYGASRWWRHVFGLKGNAGRKYIERLGVLARAGKLRWPGIEPLDATLRSTGNGSLTRVYSRFVLDLYRRGLVTRSLYRAKAGAAGTRTGTMPLAGLSAQFIEVRVPRWAKGVFFILPSSAGPAPEARLLLGGPSGRTVSLKRFARGRRQIVSVRFRSPRERAKLVLLLASGAVKPAGYVLGLAPLRARQRMPTWIALDGKLP